MAEENVVLVTQFIEEVINQRTLAAVDDLVSEGFTWHGLATDEPSGPEGCRAAVSAVFRTFPDLVVRTQDVVAEAENVAIRGEVTGTFAGSPLGPSPIARKVSFHFMAFVRVRQGRITEGWFIAEHLSLLQQLGAIVTRGVFE